jgi:hypothetical protein
MIFDSFFLEGGRWGGARTTLNTSNTADTTPRPMIRRCMGLLGMIDLRGPRSPVLLGILVAIRKATGITTISDRVLAPLFALFASKGD